MTQGNFRGALVSYGIVKSVPKTGARLMSSSKSYISGLSHEFCYEPNIWTRPLVIEREIKRENTKLRMDEGRAVWVAGESETSGERGGRDNRRAIEEWKRQSADKFLFTATCCHHLKCSTFYLHTYLLTYLVTYLLYHILTYLLT
jgi:hypothetical protein